MPALDAAVLVEQQRVAAICAETDGEEIGELRRRLDHFPGIDVDQNTVDGVGIQNGICAVGRAISTDMADQASSVIGKMQFETKLIELHRRHAERVRCDLDLPALPAAGDADKAHGAAAGCGGYGLAVRRNRQRSDLLLAGWNRVDELRRIGKHGADAQAFERGVVAIAVGLHLAQVGSGVGQRRIGIALRHLLLRGNGARVPQSVGSQIRIALRKRGILFCVPPLLGGGDQSDQQHGEGKDGRGRQFRFAPCPAPRALRRIQRPCRDRVASEKTAQIVGQFACARVAHDRIAGHAFFDDRSQIARQMRFQLARLAQRCGCDELERVLCGIGQKWRLPGNEFVADRAQAPHIGSRGDLLRAGDGLFGRHVAGRSGNLVIVGGQALFEPARQTEIGDVRVAVVVEQDVGGFQVQMQHAEPMRVIHRFGDGAK